MSKRELSPDARLVADGIAAMEQQISKGWKYDWRHTIDQWSDGEPTCCLRGALMLANSDHYGVDYRVSDLAHRVHKPNCGLEEPVIAWNDWDGIKTALCKKYNLGVLA